MHLPNETSVTTLNAVTVNVWLWLEIILNKPRRLVLSAKKLAEFQRASLFLGVTGPGGPSPVGS